MLGQIANNTQNTLECKAKKEGKKTMEKIATKQNEIKPGTYSKKKEEKHRQTIEGTWGKEMESETTTGMIGVVDIVGTAARGKDVNSSDGAYKKQ